MACIVEARLETKASRNALARERCVASTDAGAITGVIRVLTLVIGDIGRVPWADCERRGVGKVEGGGMFMV